MKDKHKAKRGDYPDSKIMDALDMCDYNVTKAGQALGVSTQTLRNWIRRSDSLTNYLSMRQGRQADKARDKLDEILDLLDPADPRHASVLAGVAKMLLDKYEPDLMKTTNTHKHEVDEEIEQKLKDLFGE